MLTFPTFWEMLFHLMLRGNFTEFQQVMWLLSWSELFFFYLNSYVQWKCLVWILTECMMAEVQTLFPSFCPGNFPPFKIFLLPTVKSYLNSVLMCNYYYSYCCKLFLVARCNNKEAQSTTFRHFSPEGYKCWKISKPWKLLWGHVLNSTITSR